MYNNWYRIAQIQQKAGLRESIPTAILAAMLAVMGGSTIWNAAQRFNVEPNEIESAMEDPQTAYLLEDMELHEDFPQNNEEIKNKNEKEDAEPANKQKIQKNIIARTIYAEGRQEPRKGLEAIASVIFNRSNGTPEDMVAEIKIPKQFSCWNSADESDWTNMKQGSGPTWNIATEIAQSMMDGSFTPIGLWNHYYNPQLADPSWAYVDGESKTKLRPYTAIGNHHFLKI